MSASETDGDAGRAVDGDGAEVRHAVRGASRAVPRLHVVTDDRVVARPDFIDLAARIARAGPDVAVHLRAPHATGRTLHRLASDLRGCIPDGAGMLVVNDRIDVAVAGAVDAVQLAARSLRPTDVPATAPRLLVGVSAHAPHEAADAGPGIDWWLVGNAFATPSHPERAGGGKGLVERFVGVARAPVIAIGGVTPERVGEVLAAGAHGVAAIRGVWDSADPVAAVHRYLSGVAGRVHPDPDRDENPDR